MGAGVSPQGRQAGECDSCSVYGTGRIHCEQSQSVNYRRAINRAETDPRVSQEHLTPLWPPQWAWTSETGFFQGVQGCLRYPPLQRVPRGSAPLPSAWPILALAHFCLCLSALSNHVQCQYGKSGTLQPFTSPRILCPGPSAPRCLPGPSGSAAERAMTGGQPDRLTLPGATAELEARQPELGQQMGLPAAVEGVGHHL